MIAMRRKRPDTQPDPDPVVTAVQSLRILTGESDDDWPDDLKDLVPRSKTSAKSKRVLRKE
jgi:hypothetical protein